MKMIYNGTPMKSLNVKHYEMNTNDATLKASDLQAGVTAYAKGKKVTGTGRAFSFAMYGDCPSNKKIPIPVSEINTVVVSAKNNAIKMTKTALEFQETDFTTAQEIAKVSIDGFDYSVTLQVVSNIITISCEKTITLQMMLGKDEYA